MPRLVSLKGTINNLNYFFYHNENGELGLRIPKKFFYTPGFWAAIAARSAILNIDKKNVSIEDVSHKSYANAIGFWRIWDDDNYEHTRKNEGIRYSTLTLLKNAEAVDNCTSTVNSCLRRFIDEQILSYFANQLCKVVGELHDNVASHSSRTGYSMAQVWAVPQKNDDYYLEFALADCGIGLKGELNRVNIENINSDEQAIEWCIEPGNTTSPPSNDEFSQRLPSDYSGNPYGKTVDTVTTDNYHQGLGLPKFIELISLFNGDARLTTGNSTLCINKNNQQTYETNIQSWQGTAIYCRFQASKLREIDTNIHKNRIRELLAL